MTDDEQQELYNTGYQKAIDMVRNQIALLKIQYSEDGLECVLDGFYDALGDGVM
jgi:hypothetical protein